MMKPMTQFLLDRFEEQQNAVPKASQELLALAEQVRTMLSQFPEDHPAVLELKKSELYREVAGLLESGKDGVPS